MNGVHVGNDGRAGLVELLCGQEKIDKPSRRGWVARRICLQQLANERFLRLPRRAAQKLLSPSRQCGRRPGSSKQRSSQIACRPNSCIHEEASARQAGQANATRRALQPSCLARPSVGVAYDGSRCAVPKKIDSPRGNPRGPSGCPQGQPSGTAWRTRLGRKIDGTCGMSISVATEG